MPDVTLRPFDPAADADRLRDWLHRPHVSRWWGEAAERLAAALQHPEDDHAVVVLGGVPVGYVCWQRVPPDELEASGLTDLPEGVVDVDVLIGEPDIRGRGVGPTVGKQLLARWSADPGVAFAGVGISISNARSLRAAEKLGFEVFREYKDPETGPSRYLLLPTPSA